MLFSFNISLIKNNNRIDGSSSFFIHFYFRAAFFQLHKKLIEPKKIIRKAVNNIQISGVFGVFLRQKCQKFETI